jgi:hypothetical protein
MEPRCPQDYYSEDRRPGWNEVVRRTTTMRTGVLDGAEMSAGFLQCGQETWVEPVCSQDYYSENWSPGWSQYIRRSTIQ